MEATEGLIKIFLEQNGYLVTASKRVDAKTSHNALRMEVDIVVEKNSVDQSSNLPLRIAGENKSYSVDARAFKELDRALSCLENG